MVITEKMIDKGIIWEEKYEKKVTYTNACVLKKITLFRYSKQAELKKFRKNETDCENFRFK